ncbi:MAG: hypothetical protein QW735_00840 [archaeon]
MRERRRRFEEENTLGGFAEAFSKELIEKPKVQIKENSYIRLAKMAAKYVKAKNEFKNKEFASALEFLGWPLTPAEVNAVPIFVTQISLILVLPILGFLGYMVFITQELDMFIFTMCAPVLILIPFILANYYNRYIINAAKAQKIEALLSIPEIVNYLIISMKLTPNLEKAVEFAGMHGRGKIAEDLKKLSWDVKFGIYRSMEEALDALAYKWGNYSEQFKHALMLIRSSIIEIDEGKRHAILDKALEDVLAGLSEEMNGYITKMRQPTIYLYYVGVLLPLMLIILLPIGAMIGNLPFLSNPLLITGLYVAAIPFGTMIFAKNILSMRPPVYVPPKIPENLPKLPKKGYMRIGKSEVPAVFIASIVAFTIFFCCFFILEPFLAMQYSQTHADLTGYVHFGWIAGVFLSFSAFVSIYLYGISIERRKLQLEIMTMEGEFEDGIYVVASRLGENRPLEEAMEYSANFLKHTKIAKVFAKTSENIRNLGMTVQSAFFDPAYGSLREVYSDFIKNSFRIVLDAASLGVQQAAKALISLSLQIKDLRKLQTKIKNMLEEITAMMKSIAFLIAPLVLGITGSMQKLIIQSLSGLSAQQTGIKMKNIPGFFSIGKFEVSQLPSVEFFIILLGIYVVEITLLLTYFTSKIEEGENDLALKINIAKTLPISVILFLAATYFSSLLITGIA